MPEFQTLRLPLTGKRDYVASQQAERLLEKE
jgi:hypothetical protein